MVPSTTPKISSGTTLEKFETGNAEKIFQGGITFYFIWSTFSFNILEKEGLTLATTSFRGS